MRVVLSIAALAALGACASAAKPAPVVAAQVVAPAAAAAAPAAAAPVAKAPAAVPAAKLVKGTPEAKAAGYRCERIGTLGTNRKEEVCTTKAERDAERELAARQRQEFKDFRASQAGRE